MKRFCFHLWANFTMVQWSKAGSICCLLIFVLLSVALPTPAQTGKKQNDSQRLQERQNEVDRIRWICSALNREYMQKKFELTEEQVRKILSVHEDLVDAYFKKIPGNDRQENIKKYEAYQKTILEKDDALKSILMTHQLKSINYFYHWNFVKDPSFFGLTDPFVIKQVNITPDQKKKLEAAAEAAKKDLNEELAPLKKKLVEIKRKYRKKILDELTPDQRKSYLKKFRHLIHDGDDTEDDAEEKKTKDKNAKESAAKKETDRKDKR